MSKPLPDYRLALAVLAAALVFSASGLVYALDSDDSGAGGACCIFSLPMKILSSLKGSSPDSGTEAETANTEPNVECPAQYSMVNDECCLDRDGNSVCDKDESTEVTETTQPETETTIETADEATTTTAAAQAPTTIAQQVTTTVATIACSKNSDCGNETRQNVCADGNVYAQQSTPSCKNPGRPGATCIMTTKMVGQSILRAALPVETCSKGCKDGKCL